MRAVFLFTFAAGSLVQDRSLSLDSSPVSKVIKLLKDMQDQLMSDKKAEEEMFDKMACWCKVNGAGKTDAVDVAGRKISDLDSRIQAMTAKASQLESSIKQLEEEVATNTASLSASTNMRDEEHSQFNANEKDMLLSIDSLKHALVVLAKSQGQGGGKYSFLQQSSESSEFASVKARLRGITTDDLLNQILTKDERSSLHEFMQAGYAPQSTEILGVLKQMKVEFEKNLADMQGTEKTSGSEFAALKSAKNAELKAGEKLIKEKTAQLGRTKVANAEAKEDLEDTTNALSADQAFLVDLKERCSVSSSEWEQRSAVRAKEIMAVSEAIGILTDDDAHDLFHKSLSFIQMSSTRRVVTKAQRAREAASRILMRQASKSGNKALVQLAASTRLDAFGTVAKSIEGMITDLRAESADEVKHKDYCNEAMHENEMAALAEGEGITDVSTQINDFASAMSTLADQIAAIKAEIADTLLNVQRANEDRAAESKQFQALVADQRATQVILQKALDRLGKFYEAQFMQLQARHHAVQGTAGPPPPMGSFSDYKQNSGSGSVMTMIESIIADAKESETDAIKAENDSEAAYHSMLKESFSSVEAKQRSVTDKTEQKAKAETGKVSSEGDKEAAQAAAESLAKTLQQLHASCDYVLANFQVRQEARASEVESLQAAIAALKSS